MANYCYNMLEITGNPGDIKKLQDCIRTNKPDECDEYDLGKIIPLKSDSAGEAYEKWGTKWFADIDFDNQGGSAMLSFDTAWSPSLPVTVEISRRFNLRAAHYYEEPGFDFEGDFVAENGIVIRDEQRDYRPVCAGCETKHDRNEMVFDEEESEHYCRKCSNKKLN
jgi:hypothetical protein